MMMKKRHSLLGATLSVAVLIIVGKLLGFAREAMIAAYYGTSAETDAFFFAQGMPSMLFPAVGHSLALAFTSLYTKKSVEQGDVSADRYASRILAAIALLGAVLGGLGTLLSPVLVPLLAPGFSGGQLELAVYLTRLTMGAFILILLQYMLDAILNAKSCFIGPKIAALLYNLTILLAVFLFGQGQGMEMLTLTVILGMAVQLAALACFCRGRVHATLKVNPFHSETWALFRLALPILLGNSVVQINNIVDKALGSLLPAGSLSALSYANALNIMVIDVFAISVSTVLYPTLTRKAASGEMTQYGETLLNGMKGLSMILIPVSCITFLDAENIVGFVYARGAFDQASVAMTGSLLSCYAPRFVFAGIREVLTRAFFAVQDTKTPMFAGAAGVGCNVVFSLLFVRWLGAAGIALGTVVSVFAISLLLICLAHKKLPELPFSAFMTDFLKQIVAGAVLLGALMAFRRLTLLPNDLLRFAADTVFGFALFFLLMLGLDAGGLRSIVRRAVKGRNG